MLSQRLTKAALALQVASDTKLRLLQGKELSTTLTDWSAAHGALLNGSEELPVIRFNNYRDGF